MPETTPTNDRFAVAVPAPQGTANAWLERLTGRSEREPIDLSGPPESDVVAVADRRGATADEVAANDRSRTPHLRWRDLSRLLPELADADPPGVLNAMRERFVAEPTEENSDLLQAAINNVVASPELRRAYAREVADAKDLFHTGAGVVDPSVADNIWYEAYADANFGGAEFFTSMTPNWGYWRQPDLRQVRAVYSSATAHDVISSVQFGSSRDEVGGQLVFFEHVRYGGRYLNFTVPSGGRRDVPWIGSDFNDTASSVLVIRRFANELPPQSVSQHFAVPSLTDLGVTMPGISMEGNPVVTWDMWPAGPKGTPHDPGRIFVKVTVPLRLKLAVKVGLMPTIHVSRRLEARYWIFPFVRNGRLTATVEHCGWYVEGGLGSPYIADAFRTQVQRSVGNVQGRVDAATSRIATVAPLLSWCYLLPGRNAERGHVADDVTLVCVR